MAERLTKDALDRIDELAELALEDLFSDWCDAQTIDQRERLHAEHRGINRLKDFIHGETSS